MSGYKCDYCGADFSRRSSLIRHIGKSCTAAAAIREAGDTVELPPPKRRGRKKKEASDPIPEPKEQEESITESKEPEEPTQQVSAEDEPDLSQEAKANQGPTPDTGEDYEKVPDSVLRENAQLQDMFNQIENERVDPVDAEIAEREAQEAAEKEKAAKRMQSEMEKANRTRAAVNRKEEAALKRAIKESGRPVLPPPTHGFASSIFSIWTLIQQKMEGINPLVPRGVTKRMTAASRKKQYIDTIDVVTRDMAPRRFIEKVSGGKMRLAGMIAEDYTTAFVAGFDFSGIPTNLPDGRTVPAKTPKPQKIRKSTPPKTPPSTDTQSKKAETQKSEKSRGITPDPKAIFYESLYPDPTAERRAIPKVKESWFKPTKKSPVSEGNVFKF